MVVIKATIFRCINRKYVIEYACKGFEIMKTFADELLTQYGNLPIKRLMAVKG